MERGNSPTTKPGNAEGSLSSAFKIRSAFNGRRLTPFPSLSLWRWAFEGLDLIPRLSCTFAVLAVCAIPALLSLPSYSQAAPEPIQVATETPGFKPSMSYADFGKGESVNIFNGGLTVTHSSAITLPQNRGGAISPTRAYNSKDQEVAWPTTNGEYGPAHGWLGLGWSLSYGRVFVRIANRDVSNFCQYGDPWSYASRAEYFYQDESGAEHRLYLQDTWEAFNGANDKPNHNNWYFTNDASYIRARYSDTENKWTLYFPDGSKKVLGGANATLSPVVSPPTANCDGNPYSTYIHGIYNRHQHGWYATEIIDRAGLTTTVAYRPYQRDPNDDYLGQPYMGSIQSIEDPFGRVIAFDVYSGESAASCLNGLLKSVSYMVDGTQVTENYSYTTRTMTKSNGLVRTYPLLQTVTDPEGLQTRYSCTNYRHVTDSYDIALVLTRLDYPTGGTTTYDYLYSEYMIRGCLPSQPWCEPLMGEVFGVSARTEYQRREDGQENRATWAWSRPSNPSVTGTQIGSIITVPVVATDPLGRETVHFFSCQGQNVVYDFPVGLEMAVMTYHNGQHFNVADLDANLVAKKLLTYKFNGGDAEHCLEETFAGSPLEIPKGNSRVKRNQEIEYAFALNGTGALLSQKVSESNVWDGFGHYLFTKSTGTGLTYPWVSAAQYNLKVDLNADPRVYQTDRLQYSYEGTATSITGFEEDGPYTGESEGEGTTSVMVTGSGESGGFKAIMQDYLDGSPFPNAGLLQNRWLLRNRAGSFAVSPAGDASSVTPVSPGSEDPHAYIEYGAGDYGDASSDYLLGRPGRPDIQGEL